MIGGKKHKDVLMYQVISTTGIIVSHNTDSKMVVLEL